MDENRDRSEQPAEVDPAALDLTEITTVDAFLKRHHLQAGVDLEKLAASRPAETLRSDGEVRYELGDVVAQGGMGAIVNVRDLNCRRNVAMKVMLPEMEGSRDLLVRFIEEAQITSQLEHPNIVPVHELAVNSAGSVFYTMKFVNGRTLSDILRGLRNKDEATLAQFGLNHLINTFLRVCDAMAFAHARGVIHRDLKPDNIMIGDFGEVLVMDWGLVKVMKPQADTHPNEAPSSEKSLTHDTTPTQNPSTSLSGSDIESIRRDENTRGFGTTMVGTVMGSPDYMSPEQSCGEVATLDGRSDLYSLGAILYQILTLQKPIDATDFDSLMAHKRAGHLTPPETHSGSLPHTPRGVLPTSLGAVAMKAMALSPQNRYPDVRAFQQDIEAWQGGFATTAENANWLLQLHLLLKRKRLLVLSASAVVLALVVGLSMALYNLRLKQQEENRRIEQGRISAPLFAELAEKLILSDDLDGADVALQGALSQNPNSGEVHFQSGRLHLAFAQFELANAAFRQSQSLPHASADGPERARAYLEMLQPVQNLPDTVVGFTRLRILSNLATALQGQEDLILASRMLDAAGRGPETLSLRMEAARKGLEQSNPGVQVDKLRMRIVGEELIVDLSKLPISDISVLRGLPITTLRLKNTAVSDISPLSGMPLTNLNLEGTRVKDFSVLRELPLTFLSLWQLEVDDLSFLEGKKLTWLNVYGTRVDSLEVLRGMPLGYLSVGATRVRDLSPLEGMPLTYLNLRGTRVTDLSAIQSLPLKDLQIQDTDVRDLSPLRGLPLTSLNMSRIRAQDLAPLAELKLHTLLLEGSELPDLSPLKNIPLRTLYLDSFRAPISVADLLHFHELRELVLPPQATEMIRLREFEKLERVGFSKKDVSGLKPVDAFFKDVFRQTSGMAMVNQARAAVEAAVGISIPSDRMLVGHSERGLDLRGIPIQDLSCLKEFPLTALYLNSTSLQDLSPLAGMPLKKLKINGTQVADIRPLRDMPLELLHMWETSVVSIAPLRGLPLRDLNIEGLDIHDISPLKGMPLETLSLSATSITNIQVLAGVDLIELRLDCRLVDEGAVENLMKLPNLTRLVIPGHWTTIDALRKHPGLRYLSHTFDHWETSTQEFWKAWDQRRSNTPVIPQPAPKP